MTSRIDQVTMGLQKDIGLYINNVALSTSDLFLYSFFRKKVFKKNAQKIIEQYELKKKILNNTTINSEAIAVEIEIYEGYNKHVMRMIEYLNDNLKDDLLGAYVHGSLGTYDEVSFSDFDALVIIKAEVFESSKRLSDVAKKLHASRSIMYDFDPLQHHGWFVLMEADFCRFPEQYFPHELFKYSKSLFSDQGLRIAVAPYHYNNSILHHLLLNLLSSIDNGIPLNSYMLKCILSQFMLLPALYMQEVTGHGVYKKDSFRIAAKHFSPTVWQIMEDVSEIRKYWHYSLPKIRGNIMRSKHLYARKMVKYIAPKIDEAIRPLITEDLLKRMSLFVDAMQLQIEAHRKQGKYIPE